MIVFYLSHPQVDIERDRPVPLWRLSSQGRARVEAVLDRPWLHGVRRIVASAETKAVETAAILAASNGAVVEIHHDMGENDRSSTGFLEPAAFEAAADRFFAEPETSWSGWERAVDAAERIEGAVQRVLARQDAGPILFVGHGGVGTLLKSRMTRQPIARSGDQPSGGGNIFAFDIAARKLLCDWVTMENFNWSAPYG